MPGPGGLIIQPWEITIGTVNGHFMDGYYAFQIYLRTVVTSDERQTWCCVSTRTLLLLLLLRYLKTCRVNKERSIIVKVGRDAQAVNNNKNCEWCNGHHIVTLSRQLFFGTHFFKKKFATTMTTETTLFHGTWPFFRTTIKWAECSSETASCLVFVGPCAAEEEDEDIFLEGDNDAWFD